MSDNRSFKRALLGVLASLLLAAPAVALAQQCPVCAQTQLDDALQGGSHVRLLSEKRGVTLNDVERAHYHVSYPGRGAGTDSYELAFMDRAGTASILSEHGTFAQVDLTSTNIPHLVNNYLHMGPIVGIVGERREFDVGKTYNSVMPRPDGRPLFLITCDRTETIAGVKGYHLVMKSTDTGIAELEVVLSPDYPFPLFVKELTGENPLEIRLVEIRPLDLAMSGE